MTDNTKLTDTELDSIVDVASAQDNGKMHELKEIVQVDENAELEAVSVETDIETDEIEMISRQIDNDLNIDLFDAADPEKVNEANREKMALSAKDSMDLSDDEAYEFIKIIDEFRKNPNAKVYHSLPEKIQTMINKLMLEAHIPVHNREDVTRAIIMEFMNNAEVEAAFVDFEKALNEALHIPSIVDMYNEHTRDIMENNIPKMIEAIKDEEPEKAEMLARVKDAYTRSYTFESVIEGYNNKSSIRKAVRRVDLEFKRSLEAFNRKNSKTRFKMHDIFELPKVLDKILHIDPNEEYGFYVLNPIEEIPDIVKRLVELKITTVDIQKFCIVITNSCENLDANDIIDAAYMYYLTKNIIMLKHTQEAKTSFAVELINNICDVIALIRNKEAEFYAENPHLVKSKSSKKSNSTRSSKKRT